MKDVIIMIVIGILLTCLIWYGLGKLTEQKQLPIDNEEPMEEYKMMGYYYDLDNPEDVYTREEGKEQFIKVK